MSSTKVRTDLKTIISGSVQKKDIHIDMNGESVAILTCNEPERNIPAMRLTVANAKNDWSNIINLVVYRNAAFKFKLVDNKTVYLIRDSEQKNPLVLIWRDHVTNHRLKNVVEGRMENVEETINLMQTQLNEVENGIKGLDNICKCIFAFINRGGNLLNTPELGMIRKKTEDDLEYFEVDD
jgi:hypothetical protein